jgi:hypothetical protein
LKIAGRVSVAIKNDVFLTIDGAIRAAGAGAGALIIITATSPGAFQDFRIRVAAGGGGKGEDKKAGDETCE